MNEVLCSGHEPPSRSANAVAAFAPLTSSIALAACGGGGGGSTPIPLPLPPPVPPPPPITGPAWFGYGRNVQYTALSAVASQDLVRIAWTTPVDLAPQYTQSGALLTHHGSPVVTTRNIVVIPVKLTAAADRVGGRNGANGTLVWSAATDYVPPPHNWKPPHNLLLTAQDRLYAPAAAGKLLMCNDADAANGAFAPQVFYGAVQYNANPAAFDGSVFINTPLTADVQSQRLLRLPGDGNQPRGTGQRHCPEHAKRHRHLGRRRCGRRRSHHPQAGAQLRASALERRRHCLHRGESWRDRRDPERRPSRARQHDAGDARQRRPHRSVPGRSRAPQRRRHGDPGGRPGWAGVLRRAGTDVRDGERAGQFRLA